MVILSLRVRKVLKRKNVNFSGGQKIANLVIPFANDDDDEGDSIVTVTLETQSGQTLETSDWNLASPNTPATATVTNFEPRQVSVSSDYTYCCNEFKY